MHYVSQIITTRLNYDYIYKNIYVFENNCMKLTQLNYFLKILFIFI
jgi:hypothetical protein